MAHDNHLRLPETLKVQNKRSTFFTALILFKRHSLMILLNLALMFNLAFYKMAILIIILFKYKTQPSLSKVQVKKITKKTSTSIIRKMFFLILIVHSMG